MKQLLTVASLGKLGIGSIIARASQIRDQIDAGEWDERPLAGRCVANVFFEPSTRTRISFDLAAQKLGAHVITFNPETSSQSKGESLRDSVETVSSIGADVLVVRHSRDGVPADVVEWTGRPVINAGDGTHEHPTQALIDLVTMRRRFGRLEGLHVAVVGDIVHSRVAGSLSAALPLAGARVTLVGPEHWLPAQTELPRSNRVADVIGRADVLYLLRVQTERGGEIAESYVEEFRIDDTRAAAMKPESVVMHAGPVNRGVEVTESVADSGRSLIGEQVRNGVPTRMAVLEALEL